MDNAVSDIKEFGGVYLPSHETHLLDWMKRVNHRVDGKLTYQHSKLQAAMQHVRHFRGAIDVGAHCGLWSMHLAKLFGELYAFEPVALHRECFVRNVQQPYNLIPCALGERQCMVSIHTSHTSSGDSWVDGEGDIEMRTLDSFAWEYPIDFIKLDCEGYELFALRGGEQLLKRWRPCVLVEQKPGRAQKFGLPETGAVDYLIGIGATLRFEKSGDYCLSWG